MDPPDPQSTWVIFQPIKPWHEKKLVTSTSSTPFCDNSEWHKVGSAEPKPVQMVPAVQVEHAGALEKKAVAIQQKKTGAPKIQGPTRGE